MSSVGSQVVVVVAALEKHLNTYSLSVSCMEALGVWWLIGWKLVV